MTKRLEVSPAPGQLEAFAKKFDDLFTRQNQRDGFRRYLEGLLLPSERNKTLTGLANTEPGRGAQEPRAQNLQWFLSESTWSAAAVNERCRAVLKQTPELEPHREGVLVIDETGDPKDGTHTAHVGRQYLGSVGKIDNGIVSVSSLWVDEQMYYPLDVRPYTPASHFELGNKDPAFRTKLKLAIDLATSAMTNQWPFKALVADSFYGDDPGFRGELNKLGVAYVMALKPSHKWWHLQGTPGSLQEIAASAPRKDWHAITRTFRDGHTEQWWALEVNAGPFGRKKGERAVIVSTEPAKLPELSTWYLVTNMPLKKKRTSQGVRFGASLEEVVRIYGLRIWVEQSYKQVKTSLGWAQYQVRSSHAILRHWMLVYCAFVFCWWQETRKDDEGIGDPQLKLTRRNALTRKPGEKKPRESHKAPDKIVAGSTQKRSQLVGAEHHAQALLVRLLANGTSPCVTAAL
jgi:SRSO17 transposase